MTHNHNKAIATPSTVAYQEDSNNFTDVKQSIKGNAIVSVKYSPMNPIDAGDKADRKGLLYVHIEETDNHTELALWVSVEHGIGSGVTYEWKKIADSTELPDAIVLDDKANDFQVENQTIKGSQLLTVKVFNVDYPTSSPDFIGQLALCRREADDTKLVFIAYGDSSGIPVWSEIGDPEEYNNKVAVLDRANDFTQFEQTIKGRQIVSVVDGGSLSVPTAVPEFDGQLFFSYKDEGTSEAQGNIWMGKGKQWLPLLSNSTDDTVARIDQTNTFTWRQRIKIADDPRGAATFTSGRKSSYDPTTSDSPDYISYAVGDVIARSYLNTEGNAAHQVYMAMEEGSDVAWVCIWDSDLSNTSLESRLTELEVGDLVQDEKLKYLDEEIDRVDLNHQTLLRNFNDHLGDYDIVNTNLTNLTEVVNGNTLKIAALETHHNNNQLAFTAHDTRIDSIEGMFSEDGQFTVNASYESMKLVAKGASHAVSMSGYNGGTKSWSVGRYESNSDDISLIAQKHGNYVRIESDKISMNQPIYINGDRVVLHSELAALEARLARMESNK